MSTMLDSLCGKQRLAECARNQPQFTEAELVQADLDYLSQRQQREARRVVEAHQLDVDAMRRAGW